MTRANPLGPLDPIYGVPTQYGSIAVPASTAPEQVSFVVGCTSETRAIGVTGQVLSFRMPFSMSLTIIKASLTVGTTGSFTVDVSESGVTILSTKLIFDSNGTTTVTSATQPVISDPDLADDSVITIDVDNIGGAAATGLKIAFTGAFVV
jgi:hypothetical protein